jgi:signal transduction histidine kinase
MLLLQGAFLALLILHAFAAYSFCHLVYLQFRQYRLGKPVWGGWTWRALTFVFAVNYLYFLSGYLSYIFSDGKTEDVPFAGQLAHVVTRTLIVPLAMQLFYVTERQRLPAHWIWQAAIRTAWGVALPVALLRGLLMFGVKEPWANLDGHLRAASDIVAAVAGMVSAIIIVMARRADDSPFRRRRLRWYVILVGLGLAQALIRESPWVEPIGELLVMAFVVVTVYYGERLTFFDVFAKRGLLFLLAVGLLTCHFAVVSRYLVFQNLRFVASSVTALTLVPLVLAMPWLYAQVSEWVDRAWLGRTFSVVGAATHFAESLQAATSEQDLLERAESSLSSIFRSKACIDTGNPAAEEAGELRIAVRIDGAAWGVARIMARPDDVPFLSEDTALLGVLAHSFASSLESQRLRDRGLALQQRQQELMLTAAQSELKALRAQINPHFLFNALNTIAALITQKPDRAEQTVEQLAEVFRYAVRRSDREWVRLAEEIDFVRAYLDIERARFGERLRVRIDVDTAAESFRIPAMIIQTLTENAIKHGIATVRGPGIITVSARSNGGCVLVSVEDNGPGFETAPEFDTLPASSSAGYGLRNVQERLRTYFGPEAELHFDRNAGTETTVVSFTIPMIAASAGKGTGA